MRRSLAAAMLLVLVAGCARSPTAYQPADVQQQGSCDGVSAPTQPSLIDAAAVVAAAVVCAMEQQ